MLKYISIYLYIYINTPAHLKQVGKRNKRRQRKEKNIIGIVVEREEEPETLEKICKCVSLYKCVSIDVFKARHIAHEFK